MPKRLKAKTPDAVLPAEIPDRTERIVRDDDEHPIDFTIHLGFAPEPQQLPPKRRALPEPKKRALPKGKRKGKR